MSAFTLTEHATEDSEYTIRGRFESSLGVAMGPTDVATIAYTVYEWLTKVVTPSFSVATLVPADVFLAVPLGIDTDPRWKGRDKYNFRHVLLGAAIPNGNREYAIEYKITPTTGGPIYSGPIRFQVDECKAN